MTSRAPSQVRLADYAPPPFLVDTVELAFDLDPLRTVVRGRLAMRRAAGDGPLRLDGEGLELLSLKLDGAPLPPSAYRLDDEGLTIFSVPDAFELETEVAIRPRDNRTGHGLFELKGKLATQCEAEGFRRITYFPDRPDVLARYEVTLSADPAAYPTLLSNGDLVAQGSGEGRHWVRWRDPYPKPCYIFAVVAGDFASLTDRFTTRSGREVELAVHADASIIGQCGFALGALKRALAWDERAFDLEYDLSRYNVVALIGHAEAMENKGLNLFGADGVIADPEITTDDEFLLIERIIGHEAFHNWTGNRVTCRDWFQLSLKEGLTRFRDQRFMEESLGPGFFRIETVKALRRNQFPEDDGPAAHPIQPQAYAEIENFYTNTIYDKGAEVVRMLWTLLGGAGFRAGFDLYVSRHDGQAVTTEELLRAMEDATGRDLGRFRRWYGQAGRPRVRASGAFDPALRQYRLTLSQAIPGRDEAPPMHAPVAVALFSAEGRALDFALAGRRGREAVLELDQAEQTFVFEDVEEPPIPSLLRGFSAPVTVETDLSRDQLAVLMAHDTDPFVRWDSAQTLLVGVVRDLAAALRAGADLAAPEVVFDAFERALDDAALDPNVVAQLLAIPDEPALSEGLGQIELDSHMAARGWLRARLARRFEPRLRDLYARLQEQGLPGRDMAAVGRRRLKNVCLDLLCALDTAEVAELCRRQVVDGATMTDRFEALSSLVHLDHPQRLEAVQAFYERWRDHPTLVDKWFRVQALSRAPGAVDDIIALEAHPAMDPANMARVLAYYGSFCRQNRVAFHDRSGKGYDFLADRLLMSDRMGRGGAHWLMPQMDQWRRHDPQRRGLMRAALERVAGTPGISVGLREVVGRALGAEAGRSR